MEIVDEPFIIKGQSDGQGTVERDEQWSSPYQFRLQRHNNSHDCDDGAFYFAYDDGDTIVACQVTIRFILVKCDLAN